MLRAIPPPVAYAAENPARATRRAPRASYTPGATTMSLPAMSWRSRVVARNGLLPGGVRAGEPAEHRARHQPGPAGIGHVEAPAHHLAARVEPRDRFPLRADDLRPPLDLHAA